MPVLETHELTVADGTRLQYRTLGEGPLVVVVHGALGTSDDYTPVAVRLASRNRVVLVDRRGYRHSEVGPTPASFVQDAEDLVAVLQAERGMGALFGHAAGALVAMHAALLAPTLVVRLALYEPPILLAGPSRQPLLEEFRDLRAAGEDGAALVAFSSGTSPAPGDVVRLWTAAPGPALRLPGVAAGVGRDLEALVAFGSDIDRWRSLVQPVTLLVGGEGRQDPLAESVRRLALVLPNARTVVLPDQGHAAHVIDPTLLAACLRDAICG